MIPVCRQAGNTPLGIITILNVNSIKLHTMNEKKNGTTDGRLERYDVLLIVGATVLLITLLYSLREVLSPPVVSLLVILFLLPLRSHRIKSFLVFLTVTVFMLWFISHASAILMPFILSLVLAYLFDPVVDKLMRLRIPRTFAVIIIVLFVVSLLALGLIFLIPQIIRELRELIDLSKVYSNKLADWVQNYGLAFLEQFFSDTEKFEEIALKELPIRLQQIFQAFFKGALNLTSAVSAALGQLLNFILVPFLFFYLLKDFNRIKSWVKDLLPLDQGWVFEKYIKKIDTILSGYFRGQLIVCLVVAMITTLGLLIFGIKYSLLLGIMAGVLNIIPYIGLAITLVFGLLVGIFSPSPLLTCVKIVAVIETVQILEGSLLSPRIVGGRVGLHPAWVMFAVLIFAHFWGFLGLLIAVPLAATIRIFVSVWLSAYRKRIFRLRFVKENDN